MLLPVILQNNGVDYKQANYSFTINPFDYKETTALELKLTKADDAPKKPYTGKPRGRKPKIQEASE